MDSNGNEKLVMPLTGPQRFYFPGLGIAGLSGVVAVLSAGKVVVVIRIWDSSDETLLVLFLEEARVVAVLRVPRHPASSLGVDQAWITIVGIGWRAMEIVIWVG
jgi:hypothetical protein